MAFQRSTSAHPTGSQWRLDQQSLLSACGLRAEVVASDRRWAYVLLHADDPGTGWDVSWISPHQARQLLAVLERELPNPIGYELLMRLRERAGA